MTVFCSPEVHAVASLVQSNFINNEVTAVSYNRKECFIYEVYSCIDYENPCILLVRQDALWICINNTMYPLDFHTGNAKGLAIIEPLTQTTMDAVVYWVNSEEFRWQFRFMPSDKVYIDGDETHQLYEICTINLALSVI